jgi:polysaccharide pyruvyl transferase WcaK-like protein
LDADLVVINGEGDAIFTTPPRFTFLFILLIIQLAKESGKPVSYVNGIISPCPIHGVHEPTVETFKEISRDISLISLRDQESFKLAEKFSLSPKRLVCKPDALFALRKELIGKDEILSNEISSSSFVTCPERRFRQSFVLVPNNYICLSAASAPPNVNREREWGSWFLQLGKQIKDNFDLPLVIVEPCAGDSFMSKIAKEIGTYFIPASTNIFWGSKILANCSSYITGRYHPSIMASFGGVPQIMLSSNSHKTFSLQQLLGETDPVVYSIASGEKTIELIIESVREAVGENHSKRHQRMKKVKELGQEAFTLAQDITVI